MALLINSWAFSNLNDSQRNATLFNGSNYTFASGRYGFPHSSILFNNGSFHIPRGGI